MFCPQCRVEYREGFTECSDCRVPLVPELPAESETEAAVETSVVLVTEEPAFLDEALVLLHEAEIEYYLESGGTLISDEEEIDLVAGAVRVRVSLRDQRDAQEFLRDLVERYSLSEEDFQGLQKAQEEQMGAFLTDAPGALVAAAEAGASAAVERLLEDGTDVNQKNDAGQTALMVAADAGDDNLVRDLLAAGADVNPKDLDGISALHLAAHKGRASIAELLLTKGADVNAQHNDGLSALMLASENGHLDCVGLLLAKGADVNLQDGRGKTASTFAENMGYTRIARLLGFKTRLDSGLTAEVTDTEGRSELLVAAADGEGELVSALIDVGADLNATDSQGRTALMWAALEGQAEMAGTLISHGAEVDAKDHGGGTALSWAADRGHIETVRMLLKRGADPNLKDVQGWTPLMWAEDKGYHDIAAILGGTSNDSSLG